LNSARALLIVGSGLLPSVSRPPGGLPIEFHAGSTGPVTDSVVVTAEQDAVVTQPSSATTPLRHGHCACRQGQSRSSRVSLAVGRTDMRRSNKWLGSRRHSWRAFLGLFSRGQTTTPGENTCASPKLGLEKVFWLSEHPSAERAGEASGPDRRGVYRGDKGRRSRPRLSVGKAGGF
jgi:hypothetical protein